MATKKVTQLTAATSAVDSDLVMIVDVDDTTMSPEGTNKKITKANLLSGIAGGDDHFIFNGGGYLSTSSEMAVSFGMSTTDSNVFNYITTVLIPIDCRVVNVITQSQGSGGSTDISIHKPTSYNQLVSSSTPLGTVTQAAHDIGVVYTSTFDTATYNFAAGDRMGVTVDSTSNLFGLSLTVLLKKI
mgnify:CR=1 FL=1